MKTGNTSEREYTFKAGVVVGVDFATEGPFKKGKNASYALNYRYSTTYGLLAPVLPDDAGLIAFQDLSFKTVFPTKKYRDFFLFGGWVHWTKLILRQLTAPNGKRIRTEMMQKTG